MFELWCLLKHLGEGGLLLLGHTNSATTTTGGLCVLTAHTQTEKTKQKKKLRFIPTWT